MAILLKGIVVMSLKNKIEICGDCILYDGDQIGFFSTGSNEVELSLTSEDLVNAEMPADKRKEILSNKRAIIQEIISRGFQIITEDD